MSDTAHHNTRCRCLSCSVWGLQRFRSLHAQALAQSDAFRIELFAELVRDTEADVTEAIRVALGADEAQPLPESLRGAT